MTTLQHDPKTKQQIKESLYGYLYDPVQKQFRTRLETIIIRNTLLGGHRHKSFNYKGESYACDSTPIPRKRNHLLPQLKPVMDEYLKDLKELNERELPFVLGFINQVLNSSNDLTDYLRLLPESVHGPVSKFIATCPCKHMTLSEETVKHLQVKNKTPIDLMKQRQVLNLIM